MDNRESGGGKIVGIAVRVRRLPDGRRGGTLRRGKRWAEGKTLLSFWVWCFLDPASCLVVWSSAARFISTYISRPARDVLGYAQS